MKSFYLQQVELAGVTKWVRIPYGDPFHFYDIDWDVVIFRRPVPTPPLESRPWWKDPDFLDKPEGYYEAQDLAAGRWGASSPSGEVPSYNVDEHSGYSQDDMDAMSDEFSGSFGLLESYQDQEYDLDAIGIESTDDLARQESEAEARYQDTLADAEAENAAHLLSEKMIAEFRQRGYRPDPDLEANAKARFQEEYVRLKRTKTPEESNSSEEPTVGRCTCTACLKKTLRLRTKCPYDI